MRSEQCDRLLDTLHKMHAMPYEHTKTLITSKVNDLIDKKRKMLKVCTGLERICKRFIDDFDTCAACDQQYTIILIQQQQRTPQG